MKQYKAFIQSFRFYPVLLLLFFCAAKGQEGYMDSLKLALKKVKDDSARCRILDNILLAESNDALWPEFNDQMYAIADRHLKTLKPSDKLYPVYLWYLSTACNNYGYIYQERGLAVKANEYNNRCLPGLQTLLKLKQNFVPEADIYEMMSSCYNNLGNNYRQMGNLNLALENAEKGLEIDRRLGDKSGEGVTLSNLGVLYSLQGNVQKALECYASGIKLRESAGDIKGVSVVFSYMGEVYMNQKNYPKALEQFKRGLKYSKVSNYAWNEACLDNYICFCYYCFGKIDSALLYLNASIKINEQIADSSGIADNFANSGLIHTYLADTKYKDDKQKQDSLRKLALSDYYHSLTIQKSIMDKSGATTSLIRITEMIYNYRLDDLKKAKELADTSLKWARELGDPVDIESAASILSLLYKEQGDFKNAYEMQVLYKEMSDSLNNEANRKAIAQKTIQYEYDKKEALQKAAHEKELIENRNTRNILMLAALIVILLLVSAFIYYTFRKNLRAKEENARHLLTGQEKERQRISKELHDGVGQHLLFLRNRLVKMNDEALVTSADETLEEVRTLSKNLYPNQLEKYGLIAAVDALVKQVKETTEVFVSHDLEGFKHELTPEQQISFYRLIQECVSNTLKHGAATAIRITATTIGKDIELVIQDDGKGFDKQKLKQAAQKSFGVLNLEERVRSFKGKVELETSPGNGTKWTFIIPIQTI